MSDSLDGSSTSSSLVPPNLRGDVKKAMSDHVKAFESIWHRTTSRHGEAHRAVEAFISWMDRNVQVPRQARVFSPFELENGTLDEHLPYHIHRDMKSIAKYIVSSDESNAVVMKDLENSFQPGYEIAVATLNLRNIEGASYIRFEDEDSF